MTRMPFPIGPEVGFPVRAGAVEEPVDDFVAEVFEEVAGQAAIQR